MCITPNQHCFFCRLMIFLKFNWKSKDNLQNYKSGNYLHYFNYYMTNINIRLWLWSHLIYIYIWIFGSKSTIRTHRWYRARIAHTIIPDVPFTIKKKRIVIRYFYWQAQKVCVSRIQRTIHIWTTYQWFFPTH